MSSAPDASSTTILVVDDSATARRITGSVIEQDCGYAAQYAADGREALNLIRQQAPAAVVTDLNMPNMDGLELVERVREDYPAVPVVLITAEGGEEVAIRALRAGAASYVPKRNLAAELPEVLQQVLLAGRQERRKQELLRCLVRRESLYELDNDPALIPMLVSASQDKLAAMGICGPGNRIRVGVALEEALLNGIYHGNLEVSSDLKREGDEAFHTLAVKRRGESPYKDRRLRVACLFTRAEAVFVVRDEGPGFDTTNLPDPTDPENLDRPSGRGILLIRTFMDDVRFNAAGNELTMVKRRDG